MKSASQTGHTLGPGAKQVPAPLRKTLDYFPPSPAPSAPPTQRASASAADCGCAARVRLRCLVTAGPRRCARASPVPVVASETWFRAPRTKPVEQPELGREGLFGRPRRVELQCLLSPLCRRLCSSGWGRSQGHAPRCELCLLCLSSARIVPSKLVQRPMFLSTKCVCVGGGRVVFLLFPPPMLSYLRRKFKLSCGTMSRRVRSRT